MSGLCPRGLAWRRPSQAWAEQSVGDTSTWQTSPTSSLSPPAWGRHRILGPRRTWAPVGILPDSAGLLGSALTLSGNDAQRPPAARCREVARGRDILHPACRAGLGPRPRRLAPGESVRARTLGLEEGTSALVLLANLVWGPGLRSQPALPPAPFAPTYLLLPGSEDFPESTASQAAATPGNAFSAWSRAGSSQAAPLPFQPLPSTTQGPLCAVAVLGRPNHTGAIGSWPS